VNVSARKFPLMDSMRAIAFLMVFVTHTAFFAGMLGDGATLRPYVARLDSGVRVFFLISAFLLYRPFVAAAIRGEPAPYVGAYAWRRFLRVVPPYWLALVAVAIWLGVPAIWDNALQYFGFAHVYTADTVNLTPLPQAWSLCVEVVFYAFLPIWAFAMRSLRARDPRTRLWLELAGCALLFVLSAAYKAWILGKGAPTDPGVLPWHFALPAFLDYFAIGMALAALSVWFEGRERDSRVLRGIESWPGIAWLVALAALVVAAEGIGLTGALDDRVTDAIFFERHYLYALIALGLILPAIWGDPARGVVRRVLRNRALLWIGMVSYGAYLFHFAVLIQLRDWEFASFAGDTTAYAWYAVGLIGALVIAAASWYGVERPIMRLRRLVPAREVERGEATLEPTPDAPDALARSRS
jgi:peptidoglycan/LPS O-acetylase OafA/YrhL